VALIPKGHQDTRAKRFTKKALGRIGKIIVWYVAIYKMTIFYNWLIFAFPGNMGNFS